jgi:hypothetical protein
MASNLPYSYYEFHPSHLPLCDQPKTFGEEHRATLTQSTVWVFGRSLAGNAGSNPARDMDVCYCWVLSVVRSLLLPEQSYWVWYVWLLSRSLNNEERLAHLVLPSYRKKSMEDLRMACVSRNISPLLIHNKLGYVGLIITFILLICGPGSSVGIATDYGLHGPGIESRWQRDFSHTSRPVLGLTRGYSGRGVVLTTHPLLAPRLRMSRATPLFTL